MKDRYKYEDTESKPVRGKAKSKELNVQTMLELDNIVEELSENKRTELAVTVIDGYNADKQSRSMREVRMEAAMKLAMQETSEKTEPWEGCANVIIPLITTASMQYAARAYPAIINEAAVAKTKVIGNDDGIAQPVIDPMTGMPPVDEQGQPVIDPETGQPPVNMIGKDDKKNRGDRRADFLNWQLMEQVENWETDTDRLLHIQPVTGNVYRKWYWNGDKPACDLLFPKNFVVDYFTTDLEKARKTHEFVLYEWEITERIRSGQYIKFNVGEADDSADEVVPDTRQEGGENTDDDASPHKMIEQHLRLDLDNDGYAEPYIATVHIPSQTIVRLRANYEKDGIVYKDGNESEIVKIKEEVYFVKYGFIPSPDGSFYDLGFGDILYNLNESANSIINRLLDAGTLASTSSGFIGRGIKMKGGSLKVKSGEFPVIDTRGGSIRDNFIQLTHPEPSRVLFDLLGSLIEMAKEITSTNQVMQGEGGNIPVGTVLQLVEQGLTGFKAVHKRTRRALGKELKILSRLNQLYLPPGLYREILDVDVENDFLGVDYDVVPIADATMLTNSQKVARAQVLAEYKDDPRVDGVKLLENIFEAVGADKKLIKGNPAPQQDPMIELQKMMMQVEQYKAQIKEQEAQAKTQREAQRFELDIQKAQFESSLQQVKSNSQAQADQMSLAIKSQDAQIKMAAEAHKLELERMKFSTDDAKSTKEIQKLDAQIQAIYAGIELERAKAEAVFAEKQQKESKVMEEREEKKESSDQLVQVIKSLKDDKKRKILIEKKPDGSITGEIN